MLLIAHRGLMDGPDPSLENQESSISKCLSEGIDVEIDLWYQNNCWYLGHDGPNYLTTFEFISQKGIWIHVKNFEAAIQLNRISRARTDSKLVFFWHENDERTMTTNGYWWTFIGKTVGPTCITLLPENYMPIDQLKTCLDWNCAGICTDYVNKLRF